MKKLKLAAVMGAVLLTAAACSKSDSTDAAADGPATGSTPAKVAEEAQAAPINIPESELVSVSNLNSCMKIAAGLLPASSDASAAETREKIARFIAPEKFKGVNDVFAIKDVVASMESDIQAFAVPPGGAKFMTFTVTPDSHHNRDTMVNAYDPQGPGFVDMTGQLREEAGMNFSEWGGRGNFNCSFHSTMDKDWKAWYVVQDEAQARAVESARSNKVLRVRFDYIVDGLDLAAHAPTIRARVAAVHLTDLNGNVLASPTYYLPEYLR